MIIKKWKELTVILFACALTCCSSNTTTTPPSSPTPPTNPGTASISPTTADLMTGQTQQFTTQITGDVLWSVNGTAGGDSTVGVIDSSGKYMAPAAQPSASVTVKVASSTESSFSASAAVNIFGSGTVTSTANPQVATYTIAPPVAATVTVQFGTDTTYALTTSAQQASGNAAPLAILVAGMKANTLYHMRAVIQLADGNNLQDTDHTFTTGTLPANELPVLTVTNPNGLTPQSGVEMLDLIGTGILPVLVSDLSGNVIWSYNPGGTSADIVQPVKPLPNGHFLVQISPSSTTPLSTTAPPTGTLDVVREIDLAGNTIREISIDTLNTRLTAAGFNYTAMVMHHDVAVLPNGHWILLVDSTQQFSNLTGINGTETVLGDALIDLDQNLNPVWMWNTFDHLEVNRHPYMFPDWTHSNAVLYSPTDGNLVLSMRHQNWLIKIDYANGKGAGDIIWTLGEGGDFTLEGGTDPTDWFYAQHGPSFNSSTTAGTYSLSLFDNGDDRMFPGGETCAQFGAPLCPYSTAQVLSLNETAKTATLTFHDILTTYSFFGGNAETLANGNIEYDLCASDGTAADAAVFEVSPDSPAQTVWQMSIPGANAYRAFRIGSLYPGVTW